MKLTKHLQLCYMWMKFHVAYSASESREMWTRLQKDLQAKFSTGKCLAHQRTCSLLSGKLDSPGWLLFWASLTDKVSWCFFEREGTHFSKIWNSKKIFLEEKVVTNLHSSNNVIRKSSLAFFNHKSSLKDCICIMWFFLLLFFQGTSSQIS